jgi:hypothetical protein
MTFATLQRVNLSLPFVEARAHSVRRQREAPIWSQSVFSHPAQAYYMARLLTGASTLQENYPSNRGGASDMVNNGWADDLNYLSLQYSAVEDFEYGYFGILEDYVPASTISQESHNSPQQLPGSALAFPPTVNAQLDAILGHANAQTPHDAPTGDAQLSMPPHGDYSDLTPSPGWLAGRSSSQSSESLGGPYTSLMGLAVQSQPTTIQASHASKCGGTSQTPASSADLPLSSQAPKPRRTRKRRRDPDSNSIESKLFREKAKTQEQQLLARQDELECRNHELKTEALELKNTVLSLKAEILAHASCNHALIQKHIKHEAIKLYVLTLPSPSVHPICPMREKGGLRHDDLYLYEMCGLKTCFLVF